MPASKIAARLLLGSPSSVYSSSSAGEVANAAGSLRDSEDEYFNDGRPQGSPTRDNGDSAALQVTPKNGAKRGRRHGLRPLHIDVLNDEENELSDSNSGGGGASEKFVFASSPAFRQPFNEGGLGEQEGRAVFAAGNFDLGGFTVSNIGLVSSPRNRVTHRPSLNEGDNFIVLSKLGSGNSGTVHKALHFPTMRIVALKALPLYDAERRAQMMRELKTLYLNLANIRQSPTTRSRVPSTASSCCASPPPALSTAEAAAVALQDNGLEADLSSSTVLETSVTPKGEKALLLWRMEMRCMDGVCPILYADVLIPVIFLICGPMVFRRGAAASASRHHGGRGGNLLPLYGVILRCFCRRQAWVSEFSG